MLSAGIQPAKTDLHPLMPLYLIILIAFSGYGLMVSIFIPMLMHGSGFFEESIPRATKVIYGGVLLALYPLGQLLGSPVIGSFADRFGRKRVLTVTLVLTIFFYLVIAYAIDIRFLWLLMGACFLAGLTESNVAICQSAIADISTQEDRGRLFAYLYGSMSMGYVAGPLIGGQLAVHFSYSVPFWLIAGLLVLVYVYVWIRFNDTFVPDRNEVISYLKTFTNLANVLTDTPIRRVYLVNFLIYFGFFGYARVLLIYMVDEWNLGVDKVTLYYAFLSVISAVSNTFCFAPVSKHLSLKSITTLSAIIGGIFIVSVVVPSSEISLWFTAGPACFICVWALSGSGSYLSTLVSKERQGRVLGNNLAIQVGAESAGAAIGGFLAAILVPLPLITYGVITALGGLVLITYKKQKDTV